MKTKFKTILPLALSLVLMAGTGWNQAGTAKEKAAATDKTSGAEVIVVDNDSEAVKTDRADARVAKTPNAKTRFVKHSSQKQNKRRLHVLA